MATDLTTYFKTHAEFLEADLRHKDPVRAEGALWRIRRTLGAVDRVVRLTDDEIRSTFSHANALDVIAMEHDCANWSELKQVLCGASRIRTMRAVPTYAELLEETKLVVSSGADIRDAAWSIVCSRTEKLPEEVLGRLAQEAWPGKTVREILRENADDHESDAAILQSALMNAIEDAVGTAEPAERAENKMPLCTLCGYQHSPDVDCPVRRFALIERGTDTIRFEATPWGSELDDLEVVERCYDWERKPDAETFWAEWGTDGEFHEISDAETLKALDSWADTNEPESFSY